MIAEIHHKNTNHSEDVLTGNFFGALRYLPFDFAMKRIFTDGTYPLAICEALRNINLSEWSERISFWKKYAEGEPDIIIELDDAVILIEVKWFSWLSSDDDVDNQAITNEKLYEKSSNQLAKYADTLERIADGRSKYLLLLAPQDSAHIIYADVNRRSIVDKSVAFGYITWQSAYDVLQTVYAEGFQRVIIGDIIQLLEVKGFAGFRDFEVAVDVDETLLWNLAEIPAQSFYFKFADEAHIEEGDYYEFS
jgi:hypothetical protein